MFQHIAFSFLTTISVVGLLLATWDPIVAYLGTNPYVYRVLLSFFLVTSLYFVVGSLFAVMDLTLSPKALRKYKTQVECATAQAHQFCSESIHGFMIMGFVGDNRFCE